MEEAAAALHAALREALVAQLDALPSYTPESGTALAHVLVQCAATTLGWPCTRVEATQGAHVLAACRTVLHDARTEMHRAAACALATAIQSDTEAVEASAAAPAEDGTPLECALLAHAFSRGTWPPGVERDAARLAAHDEFIVRALVPVARVCGGGDVLWRVPAPDACATAVAACVCAPEGALETAMRAHARAYALRGVSAAALLEHVYLSVATTRGDGTRPGINRAALAELRRALRDPPHEQRLTDAELLGVLRGTAFDVALRTAVLEQVARAGGTPLARAHAVGAGSTPLLEHVVTAVREDTQASAEAHALLTDAPSRSRKRPAAAIDATAAAAAAVREDAGALARAVAPLVYYPSAVACVIFALTGDRWALAPRIVAFCERVR